MLSRKVTIQNKAGLHARPSSMFVEVATGYDAELKVKSGNDEINGRSIMGLMLLAAEKGQELELIADGDDEVALLDALYELIEVQKFDEE